MRTPNTATVVQLLTLELCSDDNRCPDPIEAGPDMQQGRCTTSGVFMPA